MLTPEQAAVVSHLKYGSPLPRMTHDERANLQAMTVYRIKLANVRQEKRRISGPKVEAAFAEYMALSPRHRKECGLRTKIARRHGVDPNTFLACVYRRHA